jgi:hypothetical protein
VVFALAFVVGTGTRPSGTRFVAESFKIACPLLLGIGGLFGASRAELFAASSLPLRCRGRRRWHRHHASRGAAAQLKRHLSRRVWVDIVSHH